MTHIPMTHARMTDTDSAGGMDDSHTNIHTHTYTMDAASMCCETTHLYVFETSRSCVRQDSFMCVP